MNEYSMSDFRAEMKRRGVPQSKKKVRFRRESWAYVKRAVVAGARQWLSVLAVEDGDLMLPCPRGVAFGGCYEGCLCRGVGSLSVSFLRAHYEGVLKEFGHA